MGDLIQMAPYRSAKTHKKLIDDLTSVLSIIEPTITGLMPFSNYLPVQDTLLHLNTNSSMLKEYKKFSEVELQKAIVLQSVLQGNPDELQNPV